MSAVKPEENKMFVQCVNVECNKRFLKCEAMLKINGVIDVQVYENVLSLTSGGKIDTTGAMEEKVLVLDRSCKITLSYLCCSYRLRDYQLMEDVSKIISISYRKP